MGPTRQIYWNIAGHALIYGFLIVALAVVGYSIYRRAQLWQLGTGELKVDRVGERVRFALAEIFLQRRQLRDPFMGVAHLFIFYGFLAELIATSLISIQEWTGIEFLKGTFYLYYSLFSDCFGILGIVGLLMALWYRGVVKPGRFHTIADDWVAVLLLLLIFTQGFVVEGLRIAVTELRVQPELAPWSPGGYAIALMLQNLDSETLSTLHRYNWWIHAATAFVFIGYFALGKFKHVVFGTANLFLHNFEPSGKLNYPDIDELAETDPDALDILGFNQINQFSTKSLLDLDACVNCGRCESVCPASGSGVALSPRKLIQDMKNHLDIAGPALLQLKTAEEEEAPDGVLGMLLGDGEDGTTPAVLEDELWGCRTCGACMEECPVFIEHIPKIIDMRRYLVMTESKMSDEAQLFLKNIDERGHPFAGSGKDREEWFEDLDVKVYGRGDKADTLFWVGCSGAMVDRNIETSRAMVKVMQEGGVDFALLGNEEQCTGDPARRVGGELTYQSCTKTNIDTFKEYGIKKVVTACPHCFNTLKNEYPDYGAEIEVVHHTEMIDGLMNDGKLAPKKKLDSVTYHDPCYLGRHNKVYDAPRNILDNITNPGGFVEMEANKSKSRCCGSGGGYAWMDDNPEKRINHTRIEDVQNSGAATAAVGCPFCVQMFDDALGGQDPEGSIRAKDIAELVAETLEE